MGAADNGARPELEAGDFALKREHIELFDNLRRFGNGTIESIEIKAGLPFRLTTSRNECRISVVNQHQTEADRVAKAVVGDTNRGRVSAAAQSWLIHHHRLWRSAVDEQGFQPQIDPDILQLTRIKSRRLAGRYGFARHDVEDIQQELLLDYLQRSSSFDAHRCTRRTFALLVINNRIATLIEAKQAACRDYRACRISLDQPRDHLGRKQSEVGDALAGDCISVRRLPS